MNDDNRNLTGFCLVLKSRLLLTLREEICSMQYSTIFPAMPSFAINSNVRDPDCFIFLWKMFRGICNTFHSKKWILIKLNNDNVPVSYLNWVAINKQIGIMSDKSMIAIKRLIISELIKINILYDYDNWGNHTSDNDNISLFS